LWESRFYRDDYQVQQMFLLDNFMIYITIWTEYLLTHVLNRGGKGVRSLTDTLRKEEAQGCYTETIQDP
jgi:hypothetical protein